MTKAAAPVGPVPVALPDHLGIAEVAREPGLLEHAEAQLDPLPGQGPAAAAAVVVVAVDKVGGHLEEAARHPAAAFPDQGRVELVVAVAGAGQPDQVPAPLRRPFVGRRLLHGDAVAVAAVAVVVVVDLPVVGREPDPDVAEPEPALRDVVDGAAHLDHGSLKESKIFYL